MRKFKVFITLALFLVSAVWLGIGLADTTAYNVADADSTWGVTLAPYRVCISALAFDADASLQVYLDGTRLDSFPLPAMVGVDYWGQIDSFNIVRPTTTRAIVLLGAPDGRVCPSISGGADIGASEGYLLTLTTDNDSLIILADSTMKDVAAIVSWQDSLVDLNIYHDNNLDSLVILSGYHDTDLDSIVEMQTAIMADADKLNNIYSRLDSVYRHSWNHESVYFLQDATATDTTFLLTDWNINDAGKMFIVVTGDSIAHTSTAPYIWFKFVQAGFWKNLYLQIDATDTPAAMITIGDGTNTYKAWLVPTFSTKFAAPSLVFGDSICVIYYHGDANAGTISLDNWQYKE